MKLMDWEVDYCAYSLGEGDAKVTVSRTGNDVLVSGGILSNVRLVKRDLWDDYVQDYAGWHTESGTYTFSNVALISSLEIWGNDDDVFHVILCDDVRGAVEYGSRLSSEYDYEVVEGGFQVSVFSYKNAQITLENHTIIRDEVYNYQNLYIEPQSLDVCLEGPNSSFKLTGTGSIQMPFPKARELFLNRTLHATFSFWAQAENDQNAVEQFVDAWQNRLIIDENQFSTDSASPEIFCYYNRSNRANPYETLELETEKVKINRDETSLIPYSSALQLVSRVEQANWLDSKMYWDDSNKALGFCNVLDAEENPLWLPEPADMYIPYPDGITFSNADSYRFDINYSTLSGTQVYSTKDETLIPTVYGLKMTVDSVVPFEMSWEELPPAVTPTITPTSTPAPTDVPDALPPSTGDNNHPALWLSIMAVTVVVVCCISKPQYS